MRLGDKLINGHPCALLLTRSRIRMAARDDRWLSVGEIAEYLGISKDTVYAWIAAKRIPGHRIGRLWKFKRSEVDDWVQRGRAGDAQ
jgi:excisionase family DNA binding protein